jgi:signal transduction histidine kinase/DNA-binding response OmpR family regulator
MDMMERLARERRARLAAERLLEQKSRELFAANEKLALHARALSDQVVAQRDVARAALHEAQALKGQQSRFLHDLDAAHTTAVMAERRLRDSIDTIRDGFAVFDADLRLVVANRAYLAVFEGHDVAPGTSYRDILRLTGETGLIDIGDLSVDAWVAENLARWEADPIPPKVVQFSNGAWVKLVDRRARDGDIVSLALNITDQMRIYAAIEAIPDGFVLFDREQRVIMANQQYRNSVPGIADFVLPGAKLEDILRAGLEIGAYADAVGREEDWVIERLAHHLRAEGELTVRTANGRWLKIIDRPTPDGGRVGLRVDITEDREQQTALEAARQAAEAANRAKSAFLANMSHEIRTPMNGVVGMAELLCDTALTEEQRLFAETIRSSGEALLVIINDILDYSKIEAERLTLHPEPFDLERTIHEVAMLLQPRARGKGIDIVIDFDMFLPTRYVGDPGRLRQVLTNLLGNAVKFTEVGHVLIRVVGIETDPGRQQLHITVEDTGIGIPSDQLDRIFGEFNQVESEANRKFEGTGLGLAITRRLIERMDGAVWVDSEPGRGSCFGFRVALPVAEDEVAEAPHVPVTLHRALVIDDQFINRTILERQLMTCGMQVTLCRSGADALAILDRDVAFDIVVTDHEMPDMDGLTLTRHLREAGHAMPVILLSSNPAAARDHEGSGALAAILQKPILRSELYRRLQALSAPAIAPPPPAPAMPATRRMRVLSAEDNRTNQLVFRKMVKDCDIDLTFANDGREAVELWRSLDPDLIFMDISMPEMDGRQAARAIRAAEEAQGWGRVPIVALTAHAMDGDADSILAAGIDRYLTKPLRKSAIMEMMEEFHPEETMPLVTAPPEEDAVA